MAVGVLLLLLLLLLRVALLLRARVVRRLRSPASGVGVLLGLKPVDGRASDGRWRGRLAGRTLLEW